MSFNIEVKLQREDDPTLTQLTGIASYFAAPSMVVAGNFKLKDTTELRAFVEAVAKSSMVFGQEIDVRKLKDLIDDVNRTQAAGTKR
jgi:hypothetical protein